MPSKNASPKATQRHHAWIKAEARGYAAAETGARNPYVPGSYCHTSFNLGLAKALAKTKKPDHD